MCSVSKDVNDIKMKKEFSATLSRIGVLAGLVEGSSDKTFLGIVVEARTLARKIEYLVNTW